MTFGQPPPSPLLGHVCRGTYTSGLLFKGSTNDLANFRGYGQVEARLEGCFLDIDLFLCEGTR